MRAVIVTALTGLVTLPSSAFAEVHYECAFEALCYFDLTCAERTFCFSKYKCKDADEFSFQIIYQEGAKTAELTGANGTSEVQVVESYFGKTFLEILATGAVQSTTVHSTGQAVHSRHTISPLGQEILPSQYYGSCKMNG